jgi:hypothetical protein
MQARARWQLLLPILFTFLPIATHGAARHPLDALEAAGAAQ